MRSFLSWKSRILKFFLYFSIITPPSTTFVKDGYIRIVVSARDAWLQSPRRIFHSLNIGNIHHFIVKLDYGLNKITVSYIEENKTSSEELTIYYFPSLNFKVDADLYNFHQSPTSEFCKNCHSIAFQKVDKKEDLDCYTCHKEKFIPLLKLKLEEKKSPLEKEELIEELNFHPPFEELSCDYCHKEAGTRPKTPDVCETCHNITDEFYLHSPYAKGECTICHNPHSSAKSSFLRDRVNSLCYMCHTSGEYAINHPVVGHPGENKEIFCNSCHSPHGTKYAKNLKWPNQPVCMVCHKK